MDTFKLLKLVVATLLICSANSFAQPVDWGIKVGGPGRDQAYVTKVAPNGNVCVAGYFSGTTDLDPSSAVYNVTSNGGEDIFLACYSSAGAFIWGFNVGGNTYDGVYELDFDAASNVFIAGYFLGQNIDFDPSSAINTLSDNGSSGGGFDWGGDGFVAKYSATGQYEWAYALGGDYIYDVAQGLGVDEAGNVYVGGTFVDYMDIDPSPNTVNLYSGTGKSYIIKYSNTGDLIWGFNFLSAGIGGIDCSVRGIVVRNGIIYVCGFIQANADFDPSSNNVIETASGYDPYVAKYDTAGNYMFSDHLDGGSGWDYAREIAVDPGGNMYVIGHTDAGTSSLTFANSIIVPAPGGGSGSDMFIAKYSPAGSVLWAKMLGGTGNEEGESIICVDTTLICTGSFSGTMDFDPSAAVQNLISAGGTDVYVAKYDLNGNYVSAFRAGASGDDGGWAVSADTLDNFYVSGRFTGTTDFDPTTTAYDLTTTDWQGEAFLVKYDTNTVTTTSIIPIADKDNRVYVPSAFTPDNDGRNDCFHILKSPHATGFELRIYNRYGTEVFKTSDIAACWDGTFKGHRCDLGVYIYSYRFRSSAGEVISGTGNVTLIR